MAGDKFDQLYNALKADGAVSGTREHFRQFVYAPGKQGYHNRKQLYDALYADGAVSSKSYEEFAQRLGLHAVNPKPRQQKAQQPRTATTSGTDFIQNWKLMHMRYDQMTPMQQVQASNVRARMQRALEQLARQEQQRATPISSIIPTAKNFYEMMQQLSTPEAKRARAKQQREDDARTLAKYEVEGNKFVRNDGQTKGILGNDLLKLVDSSINEARELTRQQYQQNLDKMGGIYALQSVKEQAFRDAQTQEQVNRQNVLMNNLSSKINEIYSQKGMQRHIAESADKLNMSVEEYVDKYVTPEIINYAQKALTMRNQEEIMPHGALDYIAKNLSNSIIGMVVAPSVMSRDTRQRLQKGIAIADGDAKIQKVAGHKDKTYRSGIGTRFASTAVNMAADSGPIAVIGAGASAAVNTGTRVLTNGLVKAGVMKAAQKLTAKQMAFKVANMTTAQKIMSGLGTRTATGALNLAGYSGVTAALNQASTGDDTSLQAIGEAGLKGAEHGAVTGAMFGVSGAIMSPWVSKFGITGMEKSTGERLLHGAQKFGATAAGLGVEAGTMMVADNVTGDKDISFGTWLEDVVMVGAFKAGEPSNFVKMGNILHHLTHNSGGNFVIGKNANGSPIAVDIRLTPDEKNELISSASGKNLMDAFVKVDRASKTAPRDPKYKTAYTDFMNNPDVSQSTKEKVNAAMGLFNTTRGKSYRSVNDVKNKQILEYTKNGTLLTRTSYKNADERRAILYKQKLYRDNDDMMSLMGYARMKDMQFIDDDGTVTNLAFRFLKENGYDENKDITDPNNARLINELRNQKSALYLDWEKYADKNGLLGYLRSESKGYTNNFMASIKELLGKEGSIVIDIEKIMRKDPMKRTDEENRIFYHVKRALEDELFPSWRPHADQSASQGKTVAEEHSLGTDNPDSGVVVDELRNLRNAEQALDAAMDSNDVFKQTFEKLHQQGLTPAQIYDALIQNGLMQEELTPLAQYINANARVQGMQQATADAIEENVKSFISDWSYHGTLNGQAMNGEQALYVQDSSGRILLVGSGDVAFDQTTGRAKEGSGDMLVCLDPNTNELVYVKADEVTLVQNQPIDQFAAEYRQRLQMKNSEPYNQAAQEQAMLDAAKPQQEVQPKENKNEEISNNETDGKIRKGDNANSGSDGEAEENASEGDASVQQVKQPQQTRKFADGSDVPMATDSKGRPTPDYASMTPEQSAEILTEDFGENAEKVVDGQIKKAENALKDAEKMKVDYTAEPNDIMEQEALKNQTIEAAKKQLDHAQNIKKAMTAKKVAETVGKTEQTEGAHEAGSVAAQKFVNAPRLVGNKRTRMLPDGEQRMSLKDWADYYEKTSPKHQENLVGDSKTAEERKMAEKKFIDVVNLQLAFKHKFNGIVELRKIAERVGLKDIKDTDLQELAETAIVKRARGIASSESTNDAVKFERIKTLYENQPSLNQRDSERVMKQQYSTPAPYAFLADMYVKGNGKVIESALEPSAGNGMLTIGLPMDKVHVNDIDAQRLANLRRQGFKNVTSQDGTQPFADKDVDVVVTNPPFGSATPKEYDGYKISSLEGQMAINALESMKDDGRAAIIIGGKTEYAKNGSLNPKDKAFLGYLYSHYNVEDVINVDGSLYAKQGTSYPTRIILINGRRLNENAFPPVKDKARAETVKDYDELYKRIEDDILRGERMDSSIGGETRSAQPELDKQGATGTPKEGVRAGKRGGSEPDGKRESDLFDSTSVSGTHDDLENQRGTEPRQDGGLPDGDSRADGTGTEPSPSKEPTTGTNEQRGNGSGGAGRNDAQPSTDESANAGSGSGPRGQLQRVDKSVRGLSTEKVTYTPKSGNPFTLKAVMPADQQEAVNKNLEKLGDADQFLIDELGYNDKDDLYSHLAAEQVDSVALALQQAKKGNAFIIGDMTGIGKGRQAASLIRYAKKQGQVPVYFTKTAGLLSDVYRDLVDIGSPDLRPFVFGSDKEAAITDSDGNVVFALPSKSEVKRVLDYIEKNGKLPDEYDYVLTTYSQVSNGVYEFDENGARKEKKLAKGKTFGAAALSGQRRRDAIEKLMGNAYLILDESHTAGGNSGQGNYFQHIIQKAKNVTFFSATFAKRPDNMPIYALRTAMNEGGMKSSDLIDAVKRGGATLQEIMSQILTQCGQMIRRERDMTGVTIDWKAIDDPERVQEQREQYDSIIGLFNDIINFQKKYVSSYVDERNDELAAIQSTMGIKKGTAALGIKNQPFASKAFNTVQQVLLSLKAKSAAERAIDYLKQGMKPVIALNNTNESQTGNLALGEEMDAPDLGTSLKNGLEGTLRYTQKDAKDNSESGYIKLSDLGDEAVEAYHELEKKIEQTSTGLSLSPIDVIKNELQKAGYKVGELTGRQTEFVYNDNGTVTKVKRADTDKKKLARDFNDGKIDALILNKSAATGISLHASSKYKDQKKRVMIVAQQQLDVNDEVQMRGRIDRTGQVARGAYEYVVSLIPAEQRLLMMFKAKLKSLDANTTSSQKSKFNEMEVADITNKYGDKVVREYMAEHLDLYARMADPFGWEKTHGDDLSRIDPQTLVASGGGVGDGEAGADASKLLGRMALLRVSEQEKMLQEIGELYANEIQRLNEMGENDLEITELPLKAKTLHKEVWKQGAEPGGDNAFADNTYIEKVNMAILKKPMKASEVKASQDGLTGGKTWDEYKTEKKAAVKEYFDQKIADETQKYEERAVKAATKAKEKYIKDGKKGQKDSGMSDEQIEKMAGYQYDNIYKQEKDKLNDVMKNLKAKAEMFERVLDTFDTNQTFVLPTDMNNPNELSGFGNSYGRLIDIKITDNYSPNASSVSFATLDGRRKITFPIAGKVGSGENKVDIIGSIDRMTKQAAGMGDSHLRVLNQNSDNWDRLTSNESRKNGYIVTGNLMQALVDSKDQGLGGQLVKYTTDTGEVKTGILMPDRFDPKGLTTDAPINSVTDKFELSSWHGGIDEVTSSDGEVKVKRIDNNRGNFYELRVPKSKAKGGKYFMDEDLLKLVNGNNFETRGNNMLAEFKPEQLKPVLDRLSKMGVKVQEERKTSEDEGTHFREDRGLQYSKTDTKDVKKGRIIPEDVDKTVSSQIEKKFDSAIGDIVEHAEDRDKSRLVDDADYAVEEFSNLGRSVIEYYKNDYERKVEKLSGQSIGGHLGGKNDGKGNRGSYLLQYYKTILAVAERELAYRDARAKNLRETWGLQSGGTFTLGDVERIFKETNRDKEKAKLFQRVLDINKRLGVSIKVSAESPKKRSGEADIYRNIDLYIDGLTKTKAPDYAAPTIMLHEMIHEVTMGAINLVKKGKADDMLTPKQIEGVKTILEIYDKVKDDKERFKEEPYGLSDAYELTAQMADSRQRKAMDLSIWDKVVNAAHEFARKGDRSILQRLKDAWKKLFEVSEKDKMDNAINDIMDDFNETVDDISMNDIEEDGFAYKVTDKDELDRLNKEKTFRMYSGMQEVDGKLYSPMAAIIDGKRTDATEIGAWMGADERPDLVKNGKFQLVKTDKNPGAGEGPVPAAYNPYMHTSTSVMNDQFSGAYARGNIKVVEWEIPESEKTSGYHAEGAKNSVGLVPWTSGTVNSLLPKDRQRSVMLSRWRKAVRILPDEEVAEKIADQLRGTGLTIPWNVVTPSQLRELVKLGVPITTVEQGRQNPETKEKFLKQMAELEQEFPQAKFVNVKMTKDAYKEWGKNGGTKFRTDNGESNYPTSSVKSHIEKVAQKTGAKVNMVSSVDEITNKAAKAAIEDGRKITGWYDEKTGEVHLYMPNIHDRYTAEKTIWHEVVGHKGMRELFGDERFDKFLREVWYDLDKPENAALKKLVDEERKFNPLNIYDAIEEGIARLAEDGKGEPGFWNGIKNKVSDFLHEIGYRVAPNTKDVKYLLWLSKNLQKNQNDPYWKLRAEAVKYRLDHERMPAVVAHDGMFYGNDGKVRSMDNLTKAEWNEATDGEIHFRTTPSAGTALDRYHRSLDEHGYMFTESYMDNMLSLKKLMNAIVPDKKIEDIASSENPYILQNTMQGAMSDAAQMFERNVMKPLDKAMADVLDAFDGKKDDEKIRNFNLYMITKHGLERNREFFVRDFLKKMRMDEQKKQDADFLENSYYSDKEYLDNELKAGNIDLKEYYRQLDESIRNHFDADFEAGEHDYSGMHAIQEVAKSSAPYNDAEAIQSVMDSEAKMESIKKGAVKDYWDKVKAATQYSIDSDYKNGIISKELHGHVSNMFNWYVPLRKYDEATAEDTYGYITEQGDPKSYIGSTIMRARGHKYLSETNVLAQIGAMGNRSIKNGGMNAIRQAFARFARNNSGNNLITETSVWYEKDPVVNIVYERYPDIPEDATADEINQIVSDFNKDMKMKESQGMAYKVYHRDKIGYKFQRAENKSQHIVDVKIAGKTHTFIINGNPRAAQALNGLLENSGAKGIRKPLSSISRMMAQLCTSYNPEFVMRNIMRDAEFASSNVTSKEGARYGALWAKYYAQLGFYKGASTISFKDLSGTTGLGLFAKYRDGTLDTSDKVQRYFKEFMENGGETGWVQIKNMQDWTKEYKKDVKSERSKIDKGGAALRDFFFGNLANINEVFENIARFATYCASRDSNRSIIRSVYDAKEVSTNFNRHGSGDAIKSFKNGEMTGGKAAARWAYGFTASYLRHYSMFFNAGIQSTNLLVKNLKNHPVGTSINMLSIPFALGALAALGNNVLIASEDEKDRKGVKDPYGELPDYVRRNNLCIYKGGGQFVTIPLAIELRAFYGLGDLAAGLTFSPNVSGQKNPALDAVGCMSQLVPVMDYLGNSSAGKEPLNETIKAIFPSALSPFVEWELNTDWKGAPIERRGDWNENSPAWQRAYKGVPDGYMAVNKWVNAQTNDVAKGNEDMLGNSFLDMVTNPSMLNHYIGGIGGGAATFTERAIGVIKHGKDTETKDIPFLRSLLYTPSEQSSLQRTKSKWYNYKDEMEKTMANVDRLKSKNVPIDKRITNIGEYYHFQNSKEAAKVRIIELAEKQMKRWKKLRDKSSDTESINFANQNIDRIMMDAVDELDRLE